MQPSKVAWNNLETDYLVVSKVKIVKLQKLRGDLQSVKLRYFEFIDKFMTHAVNVVNQLRQYGAKISYERVIEEVLIIFPRKF